MNHRASRLIVLTLLLIFAAPGFAQQRWERAYGGTGDDEALSVELTSDSGYILVGRTSSSGAGGNEVYLVKTSALGDTMWSRTYGGTGADEGWSVKQALDGGYVVAGYTNSFGAGRDDFYVIRTDASGETLWTRTYGGGDYDEASSVELAPDGGYVIAGWTESFGAGGGDAYLVKIDASGDTLWTRTYGGSAYDCVNSVRQTRDSGYILAGVTRSYGTGSQDFYLVRTNAAGETLFTRNYGGPYNNEEAYDAVQTADGGFVAVGYASLTQNRTGAFAVRTDSFGNQLWTRTYGEEHRAGAASVVQLPDSGFVFAGWIEPSGTVFYDFYLLRMDALGETLWSKTYGGADDEAASAARRTFDGGWVVAGRTRSFGAGGFDAYLVKTDSGGIAALEEDPHASQALPPSLSLSADPSLFTRATVLSVQVLTSGAPPVLEIRDINGRLVRNFAIPHSAFRTPHCLAWDGTDNDGRRLPSGCYFCTLRAGSQTAQAKVLLAR